MCWPGWQTPGIPAPLPAPRLVEDLAFPSFLLAPDGCRQRLLHAKSRAAPWPTAPRHSAHEREREPRPIPHPRPKSPAALLFLLPSLPEAVPAGLACRCRYPPSLPACPTALGHKWLVKISWQTGWPPKRESGYSAPARQNASPMTAIPGVPSS